MSQELSTTTIGDDSALAIVVEPDLEQLDELLATALERLVDHGLVEQPAKLLDFVPPVGPSARRFIAIELIKIDMAMRVETGQFLKIELYTEQLPEVLGPDYVPLDLVMEEIQLRKDLGDVPTHEEYCSRFPQFESMLVHLDRDCEATSTAQRVERPPTFPPQTELDDFLLIQLLGSGAFASVYLAQQKSMQRLVALKVSRDAGDESQSLAKFDHANIVRVYDQRSLPNERLNLLYMQFHAGGTLADVVQANRPRIADVRGRDLVDCVDRQLLKTAQATPENSAVRTWLSNADWPTVVAWIGVQLAQALDAAHRQGVLHRDVKPANVLLSAEGVPKLADFNVSFAGAAGRAGAAAKFGGSIGYMAPEHLKAIAQISLVSEKVEMPADLYSLAVLLWELWQAERPFVTKPAVSSWSDAVSDQLDSRAKPLKEPVKFGGIAELVLERVLRQSLAVLPSDRPASGAELAGRLKLALHPSAAEMFEIKRPTWRARILSTSPWIVATLIILTPNAIGGLLNFQYNYWQVISETMRPSLERLSWLINFVFFPAGAAIIVWFSLSIIRAVKQYRANMDVPMADISDTLIQGHRAALVGGALWVLGGISIPLGLWLMHPELTGAQIVHLFISSLICGGVAMIYPFFGMALVSTWIYYPCFVGRKMQDPKFEAHRERTVKHCELYLLVAAFIPLLGAMLLLMRENNSRIFTIGSVLASMLGLLAAWLAYHAVVQGWTRMSSVLSNKSDSVPVA